MLHMQHAHVVALLVRPHDAVRSKAQRDAIARARRTPAAEAGADAVPAAIRRAPKIHRPRPA
jgi:hypothetical protein